MRASRSSFRCWGYDMSEAGKADDVVIRIRGLVNELGGNLINDNVDLDVKSGEVMGVVGGSGTVKSVLLRSIVCLNHPKSGSIKVFGEEAGHSDAEETPR